MTTNNDDNKLSQYSIKLASQNTLNESIETNDGIIPQAVYDNLPSLLKESCAIFKDKHERDIFLTGALAVLGGCFHKLCAYNEIDKKRVFTNLLSIIVGPPASGKGALNYAGKLARKIADTYDATNKKLFKKNKSSLFIPGNISSSGMIQLLTNNAGVGTMLESEIDTIVTANKQDWGNYSEVIRKAFENEEYSMYRKGKEKPEHFKIDSIKLSVAISGTANQFRQLMYSSENGLFSRGTYYVFEPAEEKYKFTGRLSSDIEVEAKFASFAKIANDYYELHSMFEEVQVIFSGEQLNQIGELLQDLKDSKEFPFEMGANIKRAFIMAQKIAALLTLVEECESGSLQDKLSCSAKGLSTTLELIPIYLQHALNAYELLPSKGTSNLNPSQQQLLLLLPDEFTKAEAIKLGTDNNMKQRASYYAFESLERKGIIKLSPSGKYRKE